LGCHSKRSRIRNPRRSARAAVPALAGVAAAIYLAPQALAEPPATHAAAHHDASPQAAPRQGTSAAELLADIRQAKQAGLASEHRQAPALPTRYTIRSGDSLSAIAKHFYGNPDAWPVLYWANHSHIRWANVIEAGQVLKVPVKPARIPRAPSLLAPPAPAPVRVAPQAAPAARSYHAPVRSAPAVTTSIYSGGTPGGSFGACVVARESGGNSQVMNSSGHYGLYQFSASTWAAYGGSPSTFGHASVAEQNQVFANALARGGQSNWSPYDGC
jgi:LysM repeat protein